ncbi:substrate-binding periplasmic protein [Chitinimonas sp. BJB300]|uniref:substrate-binding periplasmic protein n=2 Tax=Chitinimonas sp. BJB300 TaxID=1559339 RepID=UPI0013042909|nr:transporter substrate-binding domain-containing protein [Chitinimonas sp. BJB300]
MSMPRGLLLSVCLFLLIPQAWSAEQIRLANGEWAPYLSEKLPHAGYASHIVTEAFKAVGVEVQYEYYPWARAQELVKAGAIDGSLVWSISAEREKFALFSDPVFVDDEVVFYLRAKPLVWQRTEDLSGLVMGIALGSKLGVWEPLVKSGAIRRELTIDVHTGFLQLMARRIDFFPLVKSVGLHLLRNRFPPDVAERITYSSIVTDRREYRLMLSQQLPRSTELIKRFNEGLAKLQSNGKYAKMEKDFYAGRYDH